MFWFLFWIKVHFFFLLAYGSSSKKEFHVSQVIDSVWKPLKSWLSLEWVDLKEDKECETQHCHKSPLLSILAFLFLLLEFIFYFIFTFSLFYFSQLLLGA